MSLSISSGIHCINPQIFAGLMVLCKTIRMLARRYCILKWVDPKDKINQVDFYASESYSEFTKKAFKIKLVYDINSVIDFGARGRVLYIKILNT